MRLDSARDIQRKSSMQANAIDVNGSGKESITLEEYLELTGKRKTKYGSKNTEFNGKRYPSKKEANFAQEVFLRFKAGEIEGYEEQVPFLLQVNGIKIGTYFADFVLRHRAYNEIVETKGFKTRDFILKWKLLQALYGDSYVYTLI